MQESKKKKIIKNWYHSVFCIWDLGVEIGNGALIGNGLVAFFSRPKKSISVTCGWKRKIWKILFNFVMNIVIARKLQEVQIWFYVRVFFFCVYKKELNTSSKIYMFSLWNFRRKYNLKEKKNNIFHLIHLNAVWIFLFSVYFIYFWCFEHSVIYLC